MRGGNNPLFVEDTSSCAEAFGVEVPMPTFCAMPEKETIPTKNVTSNFFILLKLNNHFLYFNHLERMIKFQNKPFELIEPFEHHARVEDFQPLQPH
jgi:hypothetical protein